MDVWSQGPHDRFAKARRCNSMSGDAWHDSQAKETEQTRSPLCRRFIQLAVLGQPCPVRADLYGLLKGDCPVSPSRTEVVLHRDLASNFPLCL